ncbi:MULTISPECIES: hypothetical protein [Streptomyces]|uniref:Uncharacterized protein n=1 Tax=Streptomyces ramulosus TaxID=47762 RepID=A0ABW1FXN1_9ACTN
MSVVALGTASAASQGSEKSTTAVAQAAPATDSTRAHWQPPTHQSAADSEVNTDYLINEVSPAQHGGSWYQSHLNGINVTWVAPSGRDPYDGWDWIEIVDSHGKRITWDWACANAHCDAYGSTMISKELNEGEKYQARYWSDGGRVTKGHLQAEFDFWA